ncbi:hypothetical protein D3C87_1331640 [compost metagenome]
MNKDFVEIATSQLFQPLSGVDRQGRVKPKLHRGDHFLLGGLVAFNRPRLEPPLRYRIPRRFSQVGVIALQDAHLADRTIGTDRKPDPYIPDDPGPLQRQWINGPGIVFRDQQELLSPNASNHQHEHQREPPHNPSLS